MLCKNRWQDDKNDLGRRVIWWVKISSSFLQRLNQYLSVWFFVLVNFVIMLLLITCTLKQSVKRFFNSKAQNYAVSKTNAAKEYQHSWGFLKQHVECIWIFINKKKNSNQPSIQGLNKKHKMWRRLEYALPTLWECRCKKTNHWNNDNMSRSQSICSRRRGGRVRQPVPMHIFPNFSCIV